MPTKKPTVEIPISNIARRYGYIIWRKRQDEEVQTIIGDRESINLKIDGKLQENKRIDRKKRRIGITYTLTRKLPENVSTFILTKIKSGTVSVSFK